MKKSNATPNEFVICIDNSDYPASLELHKIYSVLPDERAAGDDLLRIIDESGEDYLYAAKRFVVVKLPDQVRKSVAQKMREFTLLANKGSQPTRRTQKARARRG